MTESDAGVYACVVGTDVAHAHLVAHLEVREEAVPFAPLPGDGAKGLGIIAGTLSVLAFLLLVLTLYIFRRCRMERFKKQQAIRVSRILKCGAVGGLKVREQNHMRFFAGGTKSDSGRADLAVHI